MFEVFFLSALISKGNKWIYLDKGGRASIKEDIFLRDSFYCKLFFKSDSADITSDIDNELNKRIYSNFFISLSQGIEYFIRTSTLHTKEMKDSIEPSPSIFYDFFLYYFKHF